jgi:hypothetical protein
MIVEVMSVGRECGALAERFATHLRPTPLSPIAVIAMSLCSTSIRAACEKSALSRSLVLSSYSVRRCGASEEAALAWRASRRRCRPGPCGWALRILDNPGEYGDGGPSGRPTATLVKFWSSSRGERPQRPVRRRRPQAACLGASQRVTSHRKAFHRNRTQEVAGSSPASSMKGLQTHVFCFLE